MSGHVLVTGAAGLLGGAVVADLREHGHQVVAMVRHDSEAPDGVPTVVGDATDATLLSSVVDRLGRDAHGAPTAVVHLAAIPAPIGPPIRVFTNNTAATFAVLEAAGAGGVDRVVLASSISGLGLAFGRPTLRPHYVPVDEQHPTLAEDPYALSKIVDETTAAMMHRRWGTDVLAIRFPFVGHGDRLANRIREAAQDPGALRGDLWGYLHTDDAARAVRVALAREVPGCHVVTVAAPDTVSALSTHELLATYLPDVPVRRDLSGHATLHDLSRARSLLGFEAEHGWRAPVRATSGRGR